MYNFNKEYLCGMIINCTKTKEVLRKGYTGFLAHVVGIVEMENPWFEISTNHSRFLRCFFGWPIIVSAQKRNKVQYRTSSKHSINFGNVYRMALTKLQELKKQLQNY